MKRQLWLIVATFSITSLLFETETLADAWASATGTFIETVDRQVEKSGVRSATAAVKNTSSLNDDYEADGSVNGPRLKADAFAFFASHGFGAVSNAEARWEDVLRVTDPGVVIAYIAQDLGTTYVYFRPFYEGFAIRGGSVNFSANLSSFAGSDGVADHVDFSQDSSSELRRVNEVFTLRVPADKFLGPGLTLGVLLTMELSVATNNQILPGEHSAVNFSHTAELAPVYFGDENGVPIAALASVAIVGESGINYMTIPEPTSTAMLLLLAAAGCG